MNLLDTFVQARKKSVPLIAWVSPDPAASIRAISTVTNGSPLIVWDIVRGLVGLNEAGRNAVSDVLQGSDAAMRANPVESLTLAQAFPLKSVLFILNAQRILTEYTVIQAVWNLRDSNASNGRTTVMFAPALTLPVELANDVMTLDEPLPDDAAIAEILAKSHKDAGLDVPDGLERAIDAVRGIPSFPIEQAAAMSLSRAGLDVPGLWERKRRMIEQTRGLSIYRGKETFTDIGGCESYKGFMRRMRDGRDKPNVIVFVDEIEKSVSGSSGDSTNTQQDQLMCLLTEMQDRGYTGNLSLGPPGAAKTLCAYATGNEMGIPLIKLDLGAMKDSLLGNSEMYLRNALKVIYTVSQGKAHWIGTCNSFGTLPPELKRRFTDAIFFFDLPTVEENRGIWNIFLRKYDLDPSQAMPQANGWTGAEIRNCCALAYRFRIPLTEAATYIVPVCKSAAQQIERLRTEASGKFISASYAGTYRYEPQAATSGRMLEV